MQGKFSFHYVAALLICGHNTAALDSFLEELVRNDEIKHQMQKIKVSFNEGMEDSFASVFVCSKGLPKKSFEFDLNKNQSAIDAYPRLKDKAYNLLETEKIQSLYHLLENKDNCTAKGIGDWLRKF